MFFLIIHTINRKKVNMKIRLGYVAITNALNITSSSTITYTNFIKKQDYNILYEIINNNLKALEEILKYNIKNKIHFYRLTSKLIPLATHPDIKYDYIKPFLKEFTIISKIIKDNNLRIDVHPDQFAVLNSVKKEVIKNTIQILLYHYNILHVLNIKDKIIILHVGSNAFGKQKSMTRFINNFQKLPYYLKQCIAIENDDKIFSIVDCLYIANELNIPVILDYHHFICHNPENINIEDVILDVFKTWKNKTPKIHFSSPKGNSKKDFRSHHDYIDVMTFISFIDKIKNINIDFDIMIEAKAKDDALFRLVRQLKYLTNYTFIDETTFII